MSEYRRQIVIGGVAAVIVGIILIASIAYLPLVSTTTTSSTRSSSGGNTQTAQQVSTYSTVSSSGLKLEILMNASSISSHGNLGLQIALVNTLNQNHLLPVNMSANPNIANWDIYDTNCGLSSVEHTFGFALFPGHVTGANISEAGNPLLLAPPVALSCPNPFYNTGYIQNIEFQPDSHIATLSANASFTNIFKGETLNMSVNAFTRGCTTTSYTVLGGKEIYNGTTTTSGQSGQLTYSCGGGSTLDGYWTKPTNGSYVYISGRTNDSVIAGLANLYSNYFHYFPIGSYTVVAEDLWNQTVYAYFQVVKGYVGPAETTSTSSNQISSSVMSCSAAYSNYTVNNASLYLNPNSGSIANLCVKYFYYNATAAITINALDQLTIYRPVLSSSSTISNANSLFSISVNIQKIQIGGPRLLDEGSLVVYTIRSTGSAPSGTYEIGLPGILYPQDIGCGNGIYATLQIGNTTNPEVVSSCHVDPAPQNNPGVIYSEIVGMTNST